MTAALILQFYIVIIIIVITIVVVIAIITVIPIISMIIIEATPPTSRPGTGADEVTGGKQRSSAQTLVAT